MGAKGKYEQAAPKFLKYIGEGYTNRRAARVCGIDETTIYEWFKKHPEFEDAVTQKRTEYQENMAADTEVSLFRRATGYKATKTNSQYIVDGNGKLMLFRKTVCEYDVPPDTAACIFLLTNLRPEKWKNRRHVDSEQKIEMTEKFKGFDAALPPTRSDEELVKEIEKDRELFFTRYGKA